MHDPASVSRQHFTRAHALRSHCLHSQPGAQLFFLFDLCCHSLPPPSLNLPRLEICVYLCTCPAHTPRHTHRVVSFDPKTQKKKKNRGQRLFRGTWRCWRRLWNHSSVWFSVRLRERVTCTCTHTHTHPVAGVRLDQCVSGQGTAVSLELPAKK